MKSITTDAKADVPVLGHLTLTGVYAGEPVCGAGLGAKTRNDSHAMYAPLDRESFRATVCPACLKAWVESYSASELSCAPEWVRQATRQYAIAASKEVAGVC